MQPGYNRFQPQSANRRGPGPMVMNPTQQTQAQQLALQQQQAAAAAQEAQKRDLARRQTRKPVDKTLPDGLDEIIIGDGAKAYRNLRDVERKLDTVMMRKRLEVMDSQPAMRSSREMRTLRIWISNTASHQPWQQGELDSTAFDFASDSQATFRVKLEGRLLPEDQVDEEPPKDSSDGQKTKTAPAAPQPTRFSHFFKQITIDFDRQPSLQPDQYTSIVWKKAAPFSKGPPPSEANFDCLEFERKGDENVNLVIKLARDEVRERSRFSKPLADLIGVQEGDRASALQGVYNYVKANGLQEVEHAQQVICDTRMKAVFGAESVFFPRILDGLMHHLQPLEPITLNYTIRVDKAFFEGTNQKTIYDILVPVMTPMAPLPAHDTEALKTLAQLDEGLALTIQALNNSKAKHAFLDSLSRDPANFVKRWISSQRRDLAIILGEAGRGNSEASNVSEIWRTREAWKDGIDGGKKIREGVAMWLNAKDKEDERRAELARRQQQQAMAAR